MKTYIEATEVTLLEEQASNIRDKLLIRILFYLGARVSEVLALEVKHIDLDSGTVTIRHLKSRTKFSCPKCGTRLGKAHIFCPKCGVKVEETVAKELEHRRMRTLPLDNETLAILKD